MFPSRAWLKVRGGARVRGVARQATLVPATPGYGESEQSWNSAVAARHDSGNGDLQQVGADVEKAADAEHNGLSEVRGKRRR